MLVKGQEAEWCDATGDATCIAACPIKKLNSLSRRVYPWGTVITLQ